MQRFLVLLALVGLCFLPVAAMADEGPMPLPASASADAKMHNDEGIMHWGKGHYDVALKHFEEASKIDSSSAEVHFNEAICLDKLGKHGDATMHFKAAQKRGAGNDKILSSPILNAHLGH